MLAILSGKNDFQNIEVSIQDDDQYEAEYLRFLTNLFSTFDKNLFSDNKIMRFSNSLRNDFNAALYYPGDLIHFYDFLKFTYKISQNSLVEIRNNVTNRLSNIAPQTISRVSYISSNIEDILESYKTDIKQMTSDIVYSRDIGLENPNITAIYLLEVHISNYRATIGAVDNNKFYTSFNNFLFMHLGDKSETTSISISIRKLIMLLLDYSKLFGQQVSTVFDLDEKSYQKMGLSIFRLANIVIASGDLQTYKEIISKENLAICKELIPLLRDFKFLCETNKHLTHYFDIANFQLSTHLINKFTPKVIFDYDLITQTSDLPDIVIDSLVNGKIIKDRETILASLDRQFYHMALARNEISLLYISRLLNLLTRLI